MIDQRDIFAGFNWRQFLAQEPVLIAIAGSNGAGKTTFFDSYLAHLGLPFVNADQIALTVGCDAYAAAEKAEAIRQYYKNDRVSFIFETVLSDPAGEKVSQLKAAADSGYSVALIFIGVESAEISDQHVALRVLQGGHDVPKEKLQARYPRTLANLKLAIQQLPYVFIYDNSDISEPYKQIALYKHGGAVTLREPLPKWFADL